MHSTAAKRFKKSRGKKNVNFRVLNLLADEKRFNVSNGSTSVVITSQFIVRVSDFLL